MKQINCTLLIFLFLLASCVEKKQVEQKVKTEPRKKQQYIAWDVDDSEDQATEAKIKPKAPEVFKRVSDVADKATLHRLLTKCPKERNDCLELPISILIPWVKIGEQDYAIPENSYLPIKEKINLVLPPLKNPLAGCMAKEGASFIDYQKFAFVGNSLVLTDQGKALNLKEVLGEHKIQVSRDSKAKGSATRIVNLKTNKVVYEGGNKAPFKADTIFMKNDQLLIARYGQIGYPKDICVKLGDKFEHSKDCVESRGFIEVKDPRKDVPKQYYRQQDKDKYPDRELDGYYKTNDNQYLLVFHFTGMC